MQVFDQGAGAASLLLDPEWKTSEAVRDEAKVRSQLAVAQQTKAQNLLTFLAADRSDWDPADENLVRGYLGLVSVEVADADDEAA